MRSMSGCPAAFGGCHSPKSMSGITRGVYPGRYSGVSKAGPAFAAFNGTPVGGIHRPVPWGAMPKNSSSSGADLSNASKSGGKTGGGGGGGAGWASAIESVGGALSSIFGKKQELPSYEPAPAAPAIPNWVWYVGAGAVAVGAAAYLSK